MAGENRRENNNRGIGSGLAGMDFQIKLSALLLCRGLNNHYEFRLEKEVAEAGKFDDVIFTFSNDSGGREAIILQAKHADKSIKKIGIDLLTSSSGDFAISKYFESYKKAKKYLQNENIKIKHAVIFTNRDFDFKKYSPVNINEFNLENITEDTCDNYSKLIVLLKTNAGGKLYRFKKKFLRSVIKKNLENLEYKKIAEELEQALGKIECLSKNKLLKKYSVLLMENVIDFKTKTFKKSFKESPQNSDELKLLQELLKSTLGKIEKKEFTILSPSFGNKNAQKCKQTWPTITLIKDEDIDDFLEHLVFAVNQPKEKELKKFIQVELGHFYYPKFIDDIRDWTKDDKNNISEPEKQYITTKSAKLYFSDIDRTNNKDNFKMPLDGYEEKSKDVIFDDNFIEKMLINFLKSNNETKMMHVSSICETLTSLKFCKILENEKKDFVFSKSSILQTNSTCLKSYETKLSNHTLLLFECDSDLEDNQIEVNIFKILTNSPDKKIVIIGRKENSFFASLKEKFLIKFEKLLEYSDIKISIDDLTVESQKKICEKKVKFQSFDVTLDKIIHVNSPFRKDEQFLLELINGKLENLGKLYLDKSSVKKLYILRKFYFKIQLNIDTILIIFSNEKDLYAPFVLKCAECTRHDIEANEMEKLVFDQIRGKNREKEICLLRKENDKLIFLEKTPNFLLTQKEIAQKISQIFDNEIILFSAPPGMGKSTTFSHLTEKIKENDLTQWVYKIDLAKFSNELSYIQKNIIRESEALEYFLEHALKLDNEKEKILFDDYLQKNGKIVLLFDAFDEISPNYKIEVIKLIQTFQKISKTKRVFISTRPYNDILEDIPKALNVLCCELQPLTGTDQRQYIKNGWTNEKFNESSFETFVHRLFEEFTNSIKYNTEQFLGIPLHTEMIVTVFEKSFYNFCSSSMKKLNEKLIQEIRSKLRPSVLYESFVEIKLRENLSRKQGFNYNNASTKRIVESNYRDLKKEMELLAMDYLFDGKINMILNTDELSNLKNKIASGERNGIIVSMKNQKAQFIHKTFAEHFAANHIVEKLKQNEEKVMDLFLNNAINTKYATLCKFVDDLINPEDNIKWKIEKIERASGKSLYFTIENECFNIATILIKNEIDAYYIEESSKRSIFHLKFNENENVLQKLLKNSEKDPENLKNVLKQRNSYGLTPLLFAAYKGNANVLKIFLKTLKEHDLFKSEMFAEDEINDNILHKACLNDNKDVLTAIIAELKENPEPLKAMLRNKDQYGLTPLLLAASKGNASVFKILVETLKNYDLFETEMFSVDVSCRNILHYACFNENQDVFIAVISELKKTPKSLKLMLRKDDIEGYTPLHLAVQEGNESVFKILVGTLKEHGLFKSEMIAEDVFDRNILHHACFNENKDVLEAVIAELKETPELLKAVLEMKNSVGRTPYVLALTRDKVDAVQILTEVSREFGVLL